MSEHCEMARAAEIQSAECVCAFLTNDAAVIFRTDHRPLPELKKLPGLKLSGQAFADIVMVFEFLHNFGETLGFGERARAILHITSARRIREETD